MSILDSLYKMFKKVNKQTTSETLSIPTDASKLIKKRNKPNADEPKKWTLNTEHWTLKLVKVEIHDRIKKNIDK